MLTLGFELLVGLGMDYSLEVDQVVVVLHMDHLVGTQVAGRGFDCTEVDTDFVVPMDFENLVGMVRLLVILQDINFYSTNNFNILTNHSYYVTKPKDS